MRIYFYIFLFAISLSVFQSCKTANTTISQSLNSPANSDSLSKEKFSGIVLQKYDNERIYRIEHYRNGKLEGKSTYFYSDGTRMMEGRYRSGMKQGKWKSWYRSGNLNEIVKYLEGNLSGMSKGFHQNGKKASLGKLCNGERVGWWYEWDENGKLLVLMNYRS